MNVITKSANAVAALTSLKQGVSNVVETLKVSQGGEYLVLSKTGKWVYGQAKTKVDPATRWAMNIPSLEHGWTCWERGDDADTSKGPIAELMVSLFTPLPAANSLKDHGYPWTQQISVELTGVGGEDNKKKVIYKVNSKGGISRIKELLEKISNLATESAPVPLIQFDHDSYQHKKWGETLTPIFKLVGWTDLEGEDLADENGVVGDKPEDPQMTRAYTRAEIDAATKGQPEEDEDEKLLREIAERRAAKLAAAAGKAEPVAEAGAPVRRRNR